MRDLAGKVAVVTGGASGIGFAMALCFGAAGMKVVVADIERLRRSLGLDQPLPVQYLAWLTGFVTGVWGFAFTDGRPVATRLAERLPATLELIGASLAIALALGAFVALFYAVTIAKLGPQILNRPL